MRLMNGPSFRKKDFITKEMTNQMEKGRSYYEKFPDNPCLINHTLGTLKYGQIALKKGHICQ